jgi:hypothetical protein
MGSCLEAAANAVISASSKKTKELKKRLRRSTTVSLGDDARNT